MKENQNLLEIFVWSVFVSTLISQPVNSQNANQSLLGTADASWSQSFDMGVSDNTSEAESGGIASSGAQGDQSHSTQSQQKQEQKSRTSSAQLEQTYNGNIAAGSPGGMTSFPSGSYNFGFTGGGGSSSPFNTGLPMTSTGSVDLNIVQ